MTNERWQKIRTTLRWLPASIAQRLARRVPRGPLNLIIALADHFEPSFNPQQPTAMVAGTEQKRRLEMWMAQYPEAVRQWPDSEGRPFVHTYFYPAEQHDASLIGPLAEFCKAGWGEIEIHLHHGIQRPDTGENTRRVLANFRDALAQLGCLSRWRGQGSPRYAFVHGNWALANSKNGQVCGVDNEMQILSDTGCYADFTLPSAPDSSQIAKINSLYECSLPLASRAPQRRGEDLQRGRVPTVFPLIMQGPLQLVIGGKNGHFAIRLENAALTSAFPPTLKRLQHWLKAGVAVGGRPDWVFIKLHCHGMDPRDHDAMLGPAVRNFLRELRDWSREHAHSIHYVSAREMVNIALAACDGREGNAGEYRDYRLMVGRTVERTKTVDN